MCGQIIAKYRKIFKNRLKAAAKFLFSDAVADNSEAYTNENRHENAASLTIKQNRAFSFKNRGHFGQKIRRFIGLMIFSNKKDNESNISGAQLEKFSFSGGGLKQRELKFVFQGLIARTGSSYAMGTTRFICTRDR